MSFLRSNAIALAALAVTVSAQADDTTSAQSNPPASQVSQTLPATIPPESDVDLQSSIKTVTVTSNAEKNPLAHEVASGALGARSELDTPFSVSAVTNEEIQAAQVTDINGIFQYDAAIKVGNSGTGQASGASFTVRGLPIDQLNGYKIDGLPIPYWSIDLPLEQFDQVQILKGLGGFMYGLGSVGGTLNFVTKRPTDETTLSVDAGVRSDDILSTHLDTGGRFGRDDAFGYRFNVNWEDGNSYDKAYIQDHAASLALDARLTDNLKWTFDEFYMKTHQNNDVNTVSVAATVTSLAPVSGTTDLAADGDWKTNDMLVLTTGFEWLLNTDWKASASYRFSKLDENYAGNLGTITDNKGDYSGNAFFVQRVFWYHQAQGVLEGEVKTGPLTHQLDFGASYQKIQFDLDAESLVTHPIGSTNIYTGAPLTLAKYPKSNYAPALYNYNAYYQTSGFATDTIGYDRWSLIVGLRYTVYDDINKNPNGSVAGSYFNHPVTPTIALTYQVAPKTNLYFSYVQALQNGTQAGTTNKNYPQAYGPIESDQYEVGVKTIRTDWSAEAALFRIQQGAGYTNPQNYWVQDGQLQYQGVELSGQWQPLQDWKIGASVNYLDTSYLQAAAADIGKQVPGASRFSAAGKILHIFPEIEGLSADLGVRYTGASYDNALNSLRFPAYTTEDFGVSYATDIDGNKLTLRGAVQNLSDERYWISNSTGGTAFPGAPRTFTLGAHLDL